MSGFSSLNDLYPKSWAMKYKSTIDAKRRCVANQRSLLKRLMRNFSPSEKCFLQSINVNQSVSRMTSYGHSRNIDECPIHVRKKRSKLFDSCLCNFRIARSHMEQSNKHQLSTFDLPFCLTCIEFREKVFSRFSCAELLTVTAKRDL